ncbi:MAG: MFS transporter [Pseudomonadales bacterium]|nr:MFS transporter [Pseudomonadales bacterium]
MSSDRTLSLFEKVNYGVGQVAEGLKNTSFGLLVLFYYNQVLEVPGTLCGLALGIALIFDAITDPLAGSLSDNWRSKLGRRHPFMYASAIPLAICFLLLFNPPELGETGLFIWLTVFAVLTRAAMTLYHVPHIALGAELTENFSERTVIVSFRTAFGTIGGFLALALSFLVFFAPSEAFPNGQLNEAAYSPFAATVSALMVITIWLSAWGTRQQIPHLPQPVGEPEPLSIRRVFSEVQLALQNYSFRWLFIGVIIVFLMVGVDGALNLYINTYFWELKPGQIFIYSIAAPVGMIAGSAFTSWIHARWDKKPSVILGTASWALCQIIPVVLRLLDLMPPNHTTELLVILILFKLVQGITVVQALVSFGSMVADIADQHELQTGKRQEGIFFGASSFSNKSASGLGTFVAGMALDLISWPRGVGIQSAADIPPDTLMMLGLLFGPIVSGFAVVSVWCYNHYNLTRAEHEEILEQLATRRAQAKK